MDNLPTVATKLRKLRKERDLSQRDLAAKADVSANAISLIERNEISPSVATLQRLATALRVKMSYFFESDEELTNIIFVKANEHPSLSGKGVMITGIGSRLTDQVIEPFLVTLAPAAESGRSPVIHTGHEFVYCLEGTIEYEIDQRKFRLEKGDSLIFEATLPHHWQNSTGSEARMLLILQTPDGSTEPVRRHFSNHPSVTHFE